MREYTGDLLGFQALVKKSTPRSEVGVLIAEAIYGPKTYVVY